MRPQWRAVVGARAAGVGFANGTVTPGAGHIQPAETEGTKPLPRTARRLNGP
jgi:hypothetical protein